MKTLRVSSLGLSIVFLLWLFQRAIFSYEDNTKALVILYPICVCVIITMIKIMKDVYDE